MRLFVALPVDERVRQRLAQAVEDWRTDEGAHAARTGHGAGWRWTRPAGWHVTLAFLGEVADERLRAARTVAAAATAGTGGISLELGVLGRFSRRVLYVSVHDEPHGVVETLGERVQRALAEADLPVQRRSVTGHLTLARAGRRQIAGLPDLVVPPSSWRVEDARLYVSRPGPQGASYEVLERCSLD